MSLSKHVNVQLSIDERDLHYRRVMADGGLDQGIPEELLDVYRQIRHQVDMVVNHLAGETVSVYLDSQDRLRSCITSGRARYVYSTDHLDDELSACYGGDYEELALNLIGMFKDGDVNVVELYSRNNWRYVTGDYCVDQFSMTWTLRNGENVEASDKEELMRVLDVDVLPIEEFIDVISSITVVPDVDLGSTGGIRVVVQDRLDGRVITQSVADVSEVVDLIRHNLLIKLERINNDE